MVKINSHYSELKREYIFPIIEKKLEELPKEGIINLGIGDIALPLSPAIGRAICEAVKKMEEEPIGYGPSLGYPFLREAIAQNEYSNISSDEIFISDGANTDTANLQELFAPDTIVSIPDPTYPVYLDTTIIGGKKVHILPCTEVTRFVPEPPSFKCDVVYLCSPSNPTGVAMNYKELAAWIDYAKKYEAVLIVDNAYAAFVTSPDVPKTIYEVPGARDVAIECKSFSKTGGFTGLRCAYSVVPKSVYNLHPLWVKRQNIKSNGVSYPIQKGAEACYTIEGKKQIKAQVRSYLKQAKYLFENLKKLGFSCYGGTDSPYIWWETPRGLKSWEFFDLLLKECRIISIPGVGFGKNGEGYIRLSAFTTEEKAFEAISRISCAKLN